MTLRSEPKPGTVPLPGKWAISGACRGWPTEWWFPGGDQVFGPRTRREWEEDADTARRICRQLCPVTAECLVHALRYREIGIWGATDARERVQIRRRMRARSVA